MYRFPDVGSISKFSILKFVIVAGNGVKLIWEVKMVNFPMAAWFWLLP